VRNAGPVVFKFIGGDAKGNNELFDTGGDVDIIGGKNLLT
jgi:hypothetical protein